MHQLKSSVVSSFFDFLLFLYLVLLANELGRLGVGEDQEVGRQEELKARNDNEETEGNELEHVDGDSPYLSLFQDVHFRVLLLVLLLSNTNGLLDVLFHLYPALFNLAQLVDSMLKHGLYPVVVSLAKFSSFEDKGVLTEQKNV